MLLGLEEKLRNVSMHDEPMSNEFNSFSIHVSSSKQSEQITIEKKV